MAHSLLLDHHLTGDWWGRGGRIAGNVFPGTLEYQSAAGEMHLQMQGMFVDSVTFPTASGTQTQITIAEELPVIFGELGDGTHASLLTCHLTNGQIGSNTNSTYGTVMTILGRHIAEFQDLYYRSARFTFSGVTAAACAQHGPIVWHPNPGWTLIAGRCQVYNLGPEFRFVSLCDFMSHR
jgi:ApeA N-terminal domain 1